MKYQNYFFYLLLLLTSGIEAADFVPTHVLVRWQIPYEMSQAPVLSIAGFELEQEIIVDSDDYVLTRIQLPDGQSLGAVIQALRQFPQVLFAEPDYPVSMSQLPNDTDFASQWYLDTLGMPSAWDLASDCSGVIIATIDTGIDIDHPDLSANLWVNPLEIASNGIDDDSNGYVDDVNGINTINNRGNPDDDNGHGTHIAGVIAAVSNNNEGIAGICWGAQLMGIKFLDRFGGGTVSNAVKGIQYALDNKPDNTPMIINNSWVVSQNSQALSDVLDLALQNNVLVTAAAGNTGADNDETNVYPTFYRNEFNNIISVANVNQQGELYVGSKGSSNFGLTSVDLAAPGADIYSTYKNNSYTSLTGTSMATPMVSAAAALVAQQRLDIDFAELKALILANVNLSTSLDNKLMIPGVLNVDKLMQNTFVKPHILYRTSSLIGKLLVSGASAELHGFGLDDTTQLLLDGESLSFSIIDSETLSVEFPEDARDGLLSSNSSNALFVRFNIEPPTDIDVQEMTNGNNVLSWNNQSNTGFVEIERATGNSAYESISIIDAPVSTYQDISTIDGACYRIRSGFEYINPYTALTESRISDYSEPNAVTSPTAQIQWATGSVGSFNASQAIDEQLYAIGLGSTFSVAVIGNIPDGLAVSNTGLLSGLVTTPGEYDLDIILTAPTGCPEQKTFKIIISDDSGSRSLASRFSGEYRIQSDIGEISRLQSRSLFSWEPEIEINDFEILDLEISFDALANLSGALLLTVDRPQLGAIEEYQIHALDRFDDWIGLSNIDGLQKLNGSFNWALKDNQDLYDLDSESGSVKLKLAVKRIQNSSAASSDNRCFIASVIYKDEPDSEVLKSLRLFRDQVLSGSSMGQYMVDQYYSISPEIAAWLLDQPVLIRIIKNTMSLLLNELFYFFLMAFIIIFKFKKWRSYRYC